MADPNDLAGSLSPSGIPQFSTAEYAHVPGTERCRICNRFLDATYFRVNGQMACSQCATEARDGQPKDSHVAFSRGLLLGIGAAIVGMVVYAAFTIITGWYIGYLALGVGYLVAKAIKKGSSGLGGRRYQVAAVLLTYAAISIAAVPIGISYEMKHRQAQKQTQAQQADANAVDGDSSQPQPAQAQRHATGTFILQLLWLGLASPFLELQDPMHGAIGLFILFIGLRIAWRLTASAPITVDGPYSAASPA